MHQIEKPGVDAIIFQVDRACCKRLLFATYQYQLCPGSGATRLHSLLVRNGRPLIHSLILIRFPMSIWTKTIVHHFFTQRKSKGKQQQKELLCLSLFHDKALFYC